MQLIEGEVHIMHILGSTKVMIHSSTHEKC
jgi:hypothetical protein